MMKLNTRNKLLAAVFIFTLLLCYLFAFSNTFRYFRLYQTEKNAVEIGSNAPETLHSLAEKEKALNKQLEQYNLGTSDELFQNLLLKELTVLCNKGHIRIIDFKAPHYFEQEGIALHSYMFSLEGGFNEILLLSSKLENNFSLGYIKELKFIKKKDYKTNRDYLVAEVILQRKELLK